MANSIDSILGNTLDGIKGMVDTKIVIGDSIRVNEEIILLPVSKVSFGFAAGGTSFGKQPSADNFGGGAGGGVKVTPVAFLVIRGTEVRTLYLNDNPDTFDKIASYMPEFLEKITSLFQKDSE